MRLLRFFDQSKQLEALRQRCDEMERQWRGLRLDYEELYERTRRLLGKIARRQQREDEVREDAPQEGADTTPGLSPSQLSINEKILARRNRLGIRGGE